MATTCKSAEDLADSLRRASEAHGKHGLQARDELGHDLCCWLRLVGERNALSGP